MMINDHTIKKILINALSPDEVHVFNQGKNFQITVVGTVFKNMSRIKRQRTVYLLLEKYITCNDIHALSVTTYTPDEWQKILK